MNARPLSFELFGTLPAQPCAIDGDERFICVMFADHDAEAGVKVIRAYMERGFKVWYDTTPSSGTMFPASVRDALDACEAAVFVHGVGSMVDSYYYQVFQHVRMMKQRRYILHIEEFKLNSVGPRERGFHLKIDPDSPELGRKIRWVFHNASPAEERLDRRIHYDPGTLIFNRETKTHWVVNLRTHEMWNEEHCPMGLATSTEIMEIGGITDSRYKPLPISFAADYSESIAEKAAVQEKALKIRTALEESLKEEREETEDNREYYRNHVFPQGYPYMDEFERLSSD